MKSGLLFRIIAGLGLSCLPVANAAAQQTGTVDWSTMGIADEAAIPRQGLTQTSAGVTTSIDWRVDTNGGYVAPAALGADFVSFEAGTQGGVTGYAQFAFNTAAKEQADRTVFFVNFSELVTDVTFTLTDVDLGGFQDAVGVFVNRGFGFENAAGAAFPQPVTGMAISPGTTAFGAGWQGNMTVLPTSSQGNLAFDFGATGIQAVAIVHTTGFGGTETNPGDQQIGLSNITFTPPPPPAGADLSLTQSVSDAAASVGSLVTYTISVRNDGQTAASAVVRDQLPSGIMYVSDDSAGAYEPNSGLWTVPGGQIANGQVRTLTIIGTVLPNGVRTNVAEIWTSDSPDIDSTPGNASTDPFEDDTATTIVTPGGTGGTAGTAPPLSCAAPDVFRWNDNAWPAGALSRSYSAPGNTPFAFSLTGATSGLQAQNSVASPVTNQDFTGGFGAGTTGLYMLANHSARGDAIQVGWQVGQAGIGVAEMQFTIFDVDYGAAQFEDRIAVAGFINGTLVAPVLTPSSANRIENGQGLGFLPNDSDQGGGNLTATFTSPIDRVVVTYGNGARAPANPGNQAIAIHDLRYCPAMGAVLSATKSVSVYDPGGQGLYMLPGNDALYTISVANVGDGATDTDSIFLSDALPAGVTFWSGDVDGGGPANGPVAFSQSGTVLNFGPNDLRFSSATLKPASFAACTYTPNGGYDENVRHVCLAPKGALQAGDPDPTFTVSFRARID